VVVDDVAPGTTVVGIPAKPVGHRPTEEAEKITLHHERIRNPLSQSIERLEARIEELEREMRRQPGPAHHEGDDPPATASDPEDRG
jgi:hypothetical protein